MKQQPNFLLLLSDEHSFRFMGHVPEDEGGEPIQTPAFDLKSDPGEQHNLLRPGAAVPPARALLTSD